MGNSPIVNRINSLLAERGIDKKKFYDDCGITSASYSLWNTGKTKPRMKNLETIADYLHVPVSYLIEGKEQKEKAPAESSERMSDDELKFALWGDSTEMDDADLDDVKRYAAFIRERKKRK